VSSVHYSFDIVKRSGGHSAAKAAAYIAREKIYDYRRGEWHNYAYKRDVVHKEILLPDHAPRDFADRAILWNSVEHVERQGNAQLSRRLIVGLPVELDREAQIELIHDHVQREFVDLGMCADVCVHDPTGEDPNPHAHVMLTMRPINPDGTWGDKSRREYVLNQQGQKIPLPKGDYKSKRIDIMGWDSRENAEKWRAAWERDVNRMYQQHGIEQRIDMRSFERQGIEREPTEHMGPEVAALEKLGVETEIGIRNREKQERNAQREQQRERGRHIRNLEEKHFIKREKDSQKEPPSYEEWLAQHKKEQARGQEREQSRGHERGR